MPQEFLYIIFLFFPSRFVSLVNVNLKRNHKLDKHFFIDFNGVSNRLGLLYA